MKALFSTLTLVVFAGWLSGGAAAPPKQGSSFPPPGESLEQPSRKPRREPVRTVDSATKALGSIGSFAQWRRIEITLAGPASQSRGERNPL